MDLVTRRFLNLFGLSLTFFFALLGLLAVLDLLVA